MEVIGELYFPAALPPGRSSGSRRIGGLMDSSLDVFDNIKTSCPCRDSKYNIHSKYKILDSFVQTGNTHRILSQTRVYFIHCTTNFEM